MADVWGVQLRGTDCWLSVEGRGWFGRLRRTSERLRGFYTTRFVEAVSPEQAAEKGEALVADELRALVVNGERPFGIAIEAVWAHSGQAHEPGRGYTWFDLDEPQMPANRAG